MSKRCGCDGVGLEVVFAGCEGSDTALDGSDYELHTARDDARCEDYECAENSVSRPEGSLVFPALKGLFAFILLLGADKCGAQSEKRPHDARLQRELVAEECVYHIGDDRDAESGCDAALVCAAESVVKQSGEESDKADKSDKSVAEKDIEELVVSLVERAVAEEIVDLFCVVIALKNVEVGENDNAIQVTYEIPTFEDVFNALPEVIEDDPSTSKDESLGRSQANYTEDQYNKEIRTSGYLAITGDKGSFAADTEAYVMDFDIYFPAVPDYGSSVNIWNGIKQNGVRSVQNFAMSYNDTYDEDGELVEAGDKFGFSVGGQFKEIEADTWYECTQVIDIKDRYTYFYVDGEYMGRHDIAAKGPVNAVGYMRAVYTPYGMDDGFMLDNIQLYEAKSEEAVEDKSNPYKYVSFGSEGLTFDGYTMNDSNQFVKSDSSLASIYGKNIGATIADSTWTIADDPEGGSNKVLAIDTALASGATYYNVSSSLHAPAEGTAVVYTIDFYLDSEVGGTDQKTLMMSKWLMKPDGDPAASSTGIWTYLYAVRSGNNVVIKQGNNGAGGFAGKNIATVSLDEWHTVTFVGTQAGDGYIYVDDELVSTDEINSGYYMAGIDYM